MKTSQITDLKNYQVLYFLITAALSTLAITFLANLYTHFYYYTEFLSEKTQSFINASFLPFILITLILIFLNAKTLVRKDKSKSFILFDYFMESINAFKQNKLPTMPDAAVKTAVLSILVKAFFFPIMLNVVLNNGRDLVGMMESIFHVNRHLIFTL
jgi:hypothetical protein